MELANVFVHFKRLQDPLMKLATYVPPTKGVRSEQTLIFLYKYYQFLA